MPLASAGSVEASSGHRRLGRRDRGAAARVDATAHPSPGAQSAATVRARLRARKRSQSRRKRRVQTAHSASAGMQRGAPPPWSMGQRRQRHRFPTEKKLDLPQLHRGRPQREARRRLRSVAVPLSDSTRPWGIGQQLAASRNTSPFFFREMLVVGAPTSHRR